MSAATWHGLLEGVQLDGGGGYLSLKRHRLQVGTLDGRGWVVSPSAPDTVPGVTAGATFDAGLYLAPVPGRYQRVSAVYYERHRPEGKHWRHEVASTAVAASGLPVLVSISPRNVARVCARPPGDFVCGG